MADFLQAPLRVGFDNPFEPFSWIVDGEPRGMVLDLVAAILDQAGMAHVFVPLALEVIEQAMLEDRIDAIASKGVTPERKSAIEFSAALRLPEARSSCAPGIACRPICAISPARPW